jgi:membrane protein DedA with SNARE-associated domain
LSTPIELLQSLAIQYGYYGIFVVSVSGSAIPFVPLPYLAIVVLMSGSMNPLLLGIVAGVGAALGKVTSYVLGRLGYLASGDRTKRNLNAIHGALARYGMWGVFIFALTPLPDDIYVIPMGIARLPFWRFFVADLSGKIMLSVLVAYLGSAYFSAAEVFSGPDSLPVLIIAAGATAAVSILIAKSDWVLAVEIFRDRGLRGVVVNARRIILPGKTSGENNHQA